MSTINREDLMKMDWKSIAAALKDPATQGRVISLMKGDRELNVHIQNLLQARQAELEKVEKDVDRQIALNNPPSTEALAAEAKAMEEGAEAAPAAEAAAEVPPATPPVVERKKIVREYQVRDESGNPIGRPTHLEAWSAEEMLDKMQAAHENATRAFHRLKKQKLQFKEQEQNRLLSPEEVKAVAAKALEAKDATEAEKVVRSIVENDFKQKEVEIQKKRDFQEGVAIGNSFLRNHLYDYNACEANHKALAAYLREHGLDYTLDNLEAAFIDLTDQGELVPVPKAGTSRPVETTTNTPSTTAAPAVAAPAEIPPAAAAAATPAAVAQPTVAPEASQPAVEATVTTPVATQPNAATPTRRLGVNGSLQPGTMSANRPSAVDPAQARREFMRELKSMNAEVMKKKLATDPQFVKQLQAYGIRVQ